MSQTVCPYCRYPLDSGQAQVACRRYGHRHHADCWRDNGGCAIYGCGSTTSDPVQDDGVVLYPPLDEPGYSQHEVWPSPDALPPPSPPGPVPRGRNAWVLAALGLAALLAVILMLASVATRRASVGPQPGPAMPVGEKLGAWNQGDEKEVRIFYDAWRGAWQSRDIERYLSHYAEDCRIKRTGKNAYGKGTLRQRMTEIFAKNGCIAVDTTSPLSVEHDSSGQFAIVTVRQHYDSSIWWDDGQKSLQLRRTDGKWLIIDENFDMSAGGPKR